MGEPVIGSIVCGSIALVMMFWNWRMIQDQKHRGRICAKEAASAARARAKTQQLAMTNNAHHHTLQTHALSSESLAEAAAFAPAAAPSKSSHHVVKLESLPEWDESSPEEEENEEHTINKEVRERFETATMSPPLSSARSRSGTTFFFDGSDGDSAVDHHRRSLEAVSS
ncbi:unnamed protein product [Pylaiella littoralis]